MAREVYKYPGGRKALVDKATQDIWQVIALKSYLHSTRLLNPDPAVDEFCVAGHRIPCK